MQKSNILLLADHPLSTSGVGTQARWLVNGLIATGKYRFKCFGGAVKHDNYDTVTVNEDFVIKPTNGFGDRNMLRQALAIEKPDVLMLFTDPRFFIWVFEMEDEVHQICPIAYNHLWDNPPWPEFNRVLYESTDLINCINWPTYEMVHKHFPEKTNYIPHAVPSNMYFALPENEQRQVRQMLLGNSRADHFVMLYVGRNARRKVTSDILVSWAEFMKQLQAKHGHSKATLVMHADPMDPEGPNLHSVIDMLHLKDNVFFSKDRIGFEQMNALYNACDSLINVSINEGFGLPLLEAKMCEKPIIAKMTGGMTRQVVDHETGFHYGIGLKPDARSLVGNQMVPYIYEDYCSHESVTNAFMQMYELGPEKRKEIGKLAREHALKEYNMNRLITEWDRTLTTLINEKNLKKNWELKTL